MPQRQQLQAERDGDVSACSCDVRFTDAISGASAPQLGWEVKLAQALHDPVRHNASATAQILEFCRGLDEQTLNATVPGTYGTIIAALRHIIDCQIDFLERLLDREPSDPWQLGATTGLDVLSEAVHSTASVRPPW
jgi:hypothetical protein